MTDKRNAVTAETRIAWRRWLSKHYKREKSVWLIIHHRKSNIPSVYYDEAVEEALCFGWIDSKPNRRDEVNYYVLFAQRNAKSNWSKLNHGRAKRMVQAGKMTKAGMRMIEIAKENGTWLALKNVQHLRLPADLKEKLNGDTIACQYFMAFPPSSKRIILEWILNAKRPETRKKRINETVALASKNKRANHFRQ